jgi:Domain of unknown function (DUF4431)
MPRIPFILAMLFLAVDGVCVPAAAQLAGSSASSGCVRIDDDEARVSATGTLTVQYFPGPPAYGSIASGDTEERVFIVRLPGPACVDDGGQFADPNVSFVTVQASPREDALVDVFRAAVGRRVTVSGEGFGAHTGHHHALLVVLADSITVR